MGELGKELAKRLGIGLVVDVLFWLGLKAVKNVMNGKTVFGQPVDHSKDGTHMDWRGNIILGSSDFRVE